VLKLILLLFTLVYDIPEHQQWHIAKVTAPEEANKEFASPPSKTAER